MDIMIIDNFLQFPKQVREWALQQNYMSSLQFKEKYGKHTDWPGIRTEGVFDLDKEYADIVFNQLASVLKRNIPFNEITIKSNFQITREQDGDSWVHQDNDVNYAAILYLNPNVDSKHGTTFYKCNNVEKWESYMDSNSGYNTMKRINSLEDSDLYKELFTPVDIIGNVFNRLVIYKGTIYHKSSSYFGTDLRDSRLTQVFFINVK